jgi:hypothetical protein
LPAPWRIETSTAAMPDFELSFEVPQRSPGPVEQPAFQPAVL